MSHNRLDKEGFLKRAFDKHGDYYDYSKVLYINSLTKVDIICPIHGGFQQTPKSHFKAGCSKCGRESQIEKAKKSQKQFEAEVITLYGNKYDFSLTNYINTKTPVALICNIHGEFTKSPVSILNENACDECCKKKTKSTDKDTFIEEAIKVYGDKDDYTNTEVVSSKYKVEVRCTKHDLIFKKDIQSYLLGCGCPKCSAENYTLIRTKTTEQFIEEAKEVHGNNCDYTDTIYKSAKDKVTIKCNKHNIIFEQHPDNHLKGGSCRKCLSENISKSLKGREGTCGYTRSGYVKQANGREACVYLIKCFNENEEFYKIGKTFLDMNKRFTKANICYKFEEVGFHFGEAGYVYDLEIELHRKYKSYKYRPNEWFAGHTECFTTQLPIDSIWEI